MKKLLNTVGNAPHRSRLVTVEGTVETPLIEEGPLGAIWRFVLRKADGSKVSVSVGPARRLLGKVSEGENVKVLGKPHGDAIVALNVFSLTQRKSIGSPMKLLGEDVFAGLSVFVIFFGIGLLPVAAVYLCRILEWQNAALVIALLGFILALAFVGVTTFTSRESLVVGMVEREVELPQFAVSVFLLAILFAVTSQQLYLNYPMQFRSGSSIEAHLSVWILFAIDNLGECFALDVPSIFDLHVSEISPMGTAGRVLVFVFRLSIDFMIIRTFFRYWQLLRRHTNVHD